MKQPKTELEKQLDEKANQEIAEHIRSEMKRYGVKYPVVAERLTAMGRPINAQSVRTKVSRGTHQTSWYWDLMKAIKQDAK